ncbi:MAG: Photosystem II reaction center protein M [Cyanobacteria bacterium M5B4]|nr:photosystem II reaction center protein M [Cyanobacteria bacterium KgW148]PLS69053.1 MAG: Photosystem II reaction center protein M [Cyanobacteria bacterium M5B4]
MEVNFLGLIATVLAVFVPSVFLIVLYLQTSSREEAGGPR